MLVPLTTKDALFDAFSEGSLYPKLLVPMGTHFRSIPYSSLMHARDLRPEPMAAVPSPRRAKLVGPCLADGCQPQPTPVAR